MTHSPASSILVLRLVAATALLLVACNRAAPPRRSQGATRTAEPTTPTPTDGQCPVGYRLDGARCVDVDECAREVTPCGTPLARCSNHVGGYACTCPPGYAGGGPSGIACSPRVVAGGTGTCVLPLEGGVLCFGLDGRPPTSTPFEELAAPRRIPGLDDAVAVAVNLSEHSCALRRDGRVACWGHDGYNALGDDRPDTPRREGEGSFQTTPRDVPGIHDAVSIAVGAASSCATLRGGSLRCWGRAAGVDIDQPEPARTVTTIPIDDVVLTALDFHNCALRADGTVACWGPNSYAQLGTGTPSTTSPGPVVVPSLENAISISVATFHSAAATATGRAVWWGRDPVVRASEVNPQRQDIYRKATEISGFDHVIATAAAEDLTCLLDREEGVVCMGDAVNGWARWRRGQPPVHVPETRGAVALTCGSMHCCVITSAGRPACWGSNGFGPINATAPGVVEVPVPDMRWRFFEPTASASPSGRAQP